MKIYKNEPVAHGAPAHDLGYPPSVFYRVLQASLLRTIRPSSFVYAKSFLPSSGVQLGLAPGIILPFFFSRKNLKIFDSIFFPPF